MPTVETIQVPRSEVLSDEETYERFYAKQLGVNEGFKWLVNSDTDVVGPDGEPVLFLRRNAIPAEAVRLAHAGLQEAATPTDNRGIAAGSPEGGVDGGFGLNKDGKRSNVWRAPLVRSGIVGFFDRTPRFPYCRLTSYALDNPEKFQKSFPLVRACDRVFKEVLPDRHAAQMAYVERTHPDFVIHGTAFTTITVNKNWQTAVHQDKGDLHEGFGVLTTIRSGTYTGGYFVIPKYQVACDMRTCDVMLADVHQWHGNTPIRGRKGHYERLSMVLYYRRKMEQCGSATDEREHARNKYRPDMSPEAALEKEQAIADGRYKMPSVKQTEKAKGK